jgi:hypothetical protein
MVETLFALLIAAVVVFLMFDMVLSWVIVPLLRVLGRAWRGE